MKHDKQTFPSGTVLWGYTETGVQYVNIVHNRPKISAHDAIDSVIIHRAKRTRMRKMTIRRKDAAFLDKLMTRLFQQNEPASE